MERDLTDERRAELRAALELARLSEQTPLDDEEMSDLLALLDAPPAPREVRYDEEGYSNEDSGVAHPKPEPAKVVSRKQVRDLAILVQGIDAERSPWVIEGWLLRDLGIAVEPEEEGKK